MAFGSWLRTALVLSCPLVAAAPALAGAPSVGFDRAAIFSAARALPPRGGLRIVAVPWAGDGRSRSETLALERFEVFAPTARIVVHTATGDEFLPAPANVYLRGRIEGEAGSRVVLSVLATGEIRGLATATGRTWLFGSAGEDPRLLVREVQTASELVEAGGEFRCALDDLGPAAFRAGSAAEEDPFAALLGGSATPGSKSGGAEVSGEGGTFDHTAVIAIETDQEFLALGPIAGNTTTATNYIADLVAFASSIYSDELQTSWVVGDVSLWTVADPWAQTNPACGLIDFGRYWNNNNGGVTRTVTHFLSGKSTNSGIAWIGVLCSGAFSIDAAQVATGCSPALTGVSNWGGAYGYTSGIDANFDLNSPSVVWDIMAFTHEIGHNFNSPHTHCYQGLGGNAASVDNCYAGQCGQSGCYCGATSLPGGTGTGSGTIMSYCHLLSGGFGNTSLTLGLDHPFGVMPERVPSRMRSHVVSVAAGNPSCLAPIGIVFIDGFGSGNTGAWSATVP
jgi:hypothetical protein